MRLWVERDCDVTLDSTVCVLLDSKMINLQIYIYTKAMCKDEEQNLRDETYELKPARHDCRPYSGICNAKEL